MLRGIELGLTGSRGSNNIWIERTFRTTGSLCFHRQIRRLKTEWNYYYYFNMYSSCRPKFGFGLAAEFGQLCIFGRYSASAECDSATVYIYIILGVACTGQYNTRYSLALLILLCCNKTLLWSGVRATWGLHDETHMLIILVTN